MPPDAPAIPAAEVDTLPPADLPSEGDQGLTELRQQVADLQTRLSEAPVPNQPVQPVQLTPEQRNKLFYEDPVGNVQATSAAIAQHTVAQAVGPALETLKEVAKGQARGEGSDAKFFDKFEGEITELVNTLPEHVRASSTAWQNATTAIRGKHVDAYVELRGSSSPTPPGAAPKAPSSPAPASPAAVELSTDEQTVSNLMGLKPEEYSEAKEANSDQAKSWGDIFTLNSRNPSKRSVSRPKAQ